MINYLSILLFCIQLSLTVQKELLTKSLFTQDIIPDDESQQFIKTSKSTRKVNYLQRTFTCEQTSISDFSKKQIIGILDWDNSYQLDISNPIPFWKLQVKVDVLLLNQVSQSNFIKLTFQSKQNQNQIYSTGSYTKKPGVEMGIDVCYKQIVFETKEDIVLIVNASLDQAYTLAGFGIKNLQLYIDTCHPSCLTCRGPTNKDCLSCETNILYNPGDNTCGKCPSGFYQNGKCVSTCNTGFLEDQINGTCIQKDENCNRWNSQQIKCDECNDKTYLIDGYCVMKISDNYKPINLNQNNQLIFKGLFSDNFGEIEIENLGLQTKNFFGNNFYSENTGAKVTSCQNFRLLGGAYLSSLGAEISKTIDKIQPHWQIEVNFVLFQIDNWTAKQKLILSVDGNSVNFDTNKLRTEQLCGNSGLKENVMQISSILKHSKEKLDLNISTNLDKLANKHSFGIRELYIIVTNCPQGCAECSENGCTKCLPKTYKYGIDCLQSCPQGTYAGKI